MGDRAVEILIRSGREEKRDDRTREHFWGGEEAAAAAIQECRRSYATEYQYNIVVSANERQEERLGRTTLRRIWAKTNKKEYYTLNGFVQHKKNAHGNDIMTHVSVLRAAE